MKTLFSLKNFRVFDNKQGATFDLSPITILTGCNSSGKSSVVKAILLLRDFFKQLCTQNIADCKLDFGNKLAKLGKFDNARNNNSNKGSKMTFTYTVRPKDMNKDLRVQLTFTADKDDTLNNGYLQEILITDIDGNVILDAEILFTNRVVGVEIDPANYEHYEQEKGEVIIHNINLNTLKNAFLSKLIKECLIDLSWNSQVTDTESSNQLSELLNVAKSYIGGNEYEELSYKINRRRGGLYELGLLSEDCFLPYNIIVRSAKSSMLFCTPIVDWTDGVDKLEVKNVIYANLRKCGVIDSNSYIDDLGDIISDFEKSNYNTFTEYLQEKEREALVFNNSSVRHDLFLDKIKDIHSFASLSYTLSSDKLSFAGVFEVLMALWQDIYPEEYNKNIETYGIPNMGRLDNESSSLDFDASNNGIIIKLDESKIFGAFKKFCNGIIVNSLTPKFFTAFEYIGDAAINIQRLYSKERDDEFSKILFNYIEACRRDNWKDINAGDFINKWVKKFGLGDHISISQTAEGLGLVVKLHKSANDKHGRLLADEGFGITKLIGTMINIETTILMCQPAIKLAFGKNSRKARTITTLAIEEPENHLHPRYQALLAEMFVDAYKNYNIHFIVETHSEYMVRKLQTLVAKKELTQDEVSLQYVYDADPEKRPKGEPHVKSIEIREDGTLRDAFGPGFFDEADNLAMDLLTIKAMG